MRARKASSGGSNGVRTSPSAQWSESASSNDEPAVLLVLTKMNRRECEMITGCPSYSDINQIGQGLPPAHNPKKAA
jgi:hypothetical protein